ncbi:MAG: shikimate dehydrogenase [Myxococcota bacterium]|nr:shikimate dehydrogenase [Myxococcota bacterium]
MTVINHHTRLVGLIGWPVAHSLSPAMHNAAFDARGMNWVYLPLAVRPGNEYSIGQAIQGLRALNFVGANVTVPHKEAVHSHLDALSKRANEIGAVNTISIRNNLIEGDNTDADGFLADLAENRIDAAGQQALIFGAGGSARAIAVALAKAGASRVTIAGRNEARVASLVSALAPGIANTEVVSVATATDLSAALGKAYLIVNCTPAGMSGQWEQSLPAEAATLRFGPGQVVYDLVYNPRKTRLINLATEQGAIGVDGLGMLVHQGALSFRIWTGTTPPIQVMRDAALDCLENMT